MFKILVLALALLLTLCISCVSCVSCVSCRVLNDAFEQAKDLFDTNEESKEQLCIAPENSDAPNASADTDASDALPTVFANVDQADDCCDQTAAFN